MRRWASAAAEAVREEYRLAMMDPGDAAAERRKASGYDPSAAPYDGPSHLTVAAAPSKTDMEVRWDTIKTKLGITTLFEKLGGIKRSSAYAKTAELAEDLRERWETSDSPLVHRIQDMQDSVFGETEQAETYKAIRRLDGTFVMNDFLATVRRDVPVVLGAYLKGDAEALAKTCLSKEMLERLGGQMKLWQHEGQMLDARILHLSEIELVEVRMHERDPLVVVQFSCQQINCVRNKSGEIVDGGEDDIQSVHYLWALQLATRELKTSDGRAYTAPVWELREMVLRGMMAVSV